MNTSSETHYQPRKAFSPRTAGTPTRAAQTPQEIDREFEQLSSDTPIVEHLTVPGFMRRISNRWHMDDVTRFGDKVGRAAEAMQLSYLTTIDASLGVIRVFPVPLMKRIYQVMSAQFGWPQIIDQPAPELQDRRIDEKTLRAHERFEEHLRAILAAAQSDDVQHSAAVLIQWLQAEMERLRAELGVEPAAATDSPDRR